MNREASPREREIAGLIAEGLSNADIAKRLVVSIRTVETHIYNGRSKFDAPDRYAFARAVWGDHVIKQRNSRCLGCPHRGNQEAIGE